MHEKISIKKHQIYCLQACMCALFSPEILQAEAVNGLIFKCTEPAASGARAESFGRADHYTNGAVR